MNIDNAIVLLAEIITDSEHNNRIQGVDFYKSSMRVLRDENSKHYELRNLYRSFCGYLAHGSFDNNEYQKILKLIEFLR